MQHKQSKQNNLVLYRRRMGFTQKHVAALLGQRDTSMISHYERCRALPPLAVALALEIVYRVPVAFLFPGMYEEIRAGIRSHEGRLAAIGQRPLPSL